MSSMHRGIVDLFSVREAPAITFPSTPVIRDAVYPLYLTLVCGPPVGRVCVSHSPSPPGDMTVLQEDDGQSEADPVELSAAADSFVVSDHHFSEDELQNTALDFRDMDEDAGAPWLSGL